MNQNKYCLSLVFVLLCLIHSRHAFSQHKEEFEELVFYIPSGLTVSKTPGSMLLSDGQSFSITINKSTYSLKKIEKSFPEYWKQSLLNEGLDNPDAEPLFVKAQTNTGWNYFRGGKTVSQNGPLPAFYYHLTVLHYLGITVRITSRAPSEELFLQKYALLMQLVSSVTFKPNAFGIAQQTSSGGQQQPQYAGNTQQTQRPSVQLNTLYLSVQGDLMANGQLSVLYFLPGGDVCTDIPESGFHNFNPQDYKTKFPERFGSYNTGNTLSVKQTNNSSPNIFTVEADESLQEKGGARQRYQKISLLNQYRWEGSYVNAMQTGSGSAQFFGDGRFVDKGLVKTLVPQTNGAFADGEGSYSSMQNSLVLQYADGRKLQLCFYMMPEEFTKGSRPDKILISHFLLVRQ